VTWFSRGRKLRRPYELVKLVAFWTTMVIVALWVLYYLSMALYLGFYFFILQPPKVVSLTQPLNLRYPDPGTHDYIYAYHCISPITYPQQYNWKLTLKLPESPSNVQAGVFMVSLALYPPDELPSQPHEEVKDMFYKHLQGNAGNPSVELEPIGNRLRIGSRPLLLHYRTDLYRSIQTLVYAIPRLASDIFGLQWFEETQQMEVNLIERFATGRNSTSWTKQCFVVSINNPNVQIYSASIEATVLLEGWRYWLYYWFWTAFFLGTTVIFFFLLFIICTYLFFRIVSKIVRGEVKLPRLWLSDDERQMRDMKDAVAMLRREKLDSKIHREPVGGFRPSSSRKQARELDSYRDSFPPLPGPRDEGVPGTTLEEFTSLPTQSYRADKPTSWLDHPIAASSNAPDPERQDRPRKGSGSKSVDRGSFRHDPSSDDPKDFEGEGLRLKQTPDDIEGPVIDVGEPDFSRKNRFERTLHRQQQVISEHEPSHHDPTIKGREHRRRRSKQLERASSALSEASAPIAIPRAESSRTGYSPGSDDEHDHGAYLGSKIRPTHGLGSDRNLHSLVQPTLHQDIPSESRALHEHEPFETPPSIRKDPEIATQGSIAEPMGVILDQFSASSPTNPLLYGAEAEEMTSIGARVASTDRSQFQPFILTPQAHGDTESMDKHSQRGTLPSEEDQEVTAGRPRTVSNVSGSEESADVAASAVPNIPSSIVSHRSGSPHDEGMEEEAGSEDSEAVGLDRFLETVHAGQDLPSETEDTVGNTDADPLTIPSDSSPHKKRKKKDRT
jgi:hypothetical protein